MSSIIPVVPLSGTISNGGKITGNLAPVKPTVISGEVSSDILAAHKYDGPYEFIPRKVEQTFPTADKLLTNDVTIDAINYSEINNPAGGKTINIGYE